MALAADPETQQRGLGRCELLADAPNRLRVDPGDRGGSIDGPLLQPFEEVVEAGRVSTTPLVVVEAGIDDRPHHAQGEGAIGAGHGPQVLVGDTRGATPERIDDHQLGAVRLRASRMNRHRCGAVESGFHAHTIT